MSAEYPKSIVHDFIRFVNAGDIERLNALISDELVFTDISGNVYREKEFMQEYLKNFPEYQILVHHMLVGGDGVAFVGRTSGSHVPSHIEDEELLVWTADVRAGLIINWRIYSSEGYASA